MGGGGGGGGCTGEDVLNALNDAFDSVTSPVYIAARTANNGAGTFANVATGHDLAMAYESLADQNVDPHGILNGMTITPTTCTGWGTYLGKLTDKQAQKIAKARTAALTSTPPVPMKTTIHPRRGNDPKKDEVFVCTGSQTSPAIIGSPYSYKVELQLPQPPPAHPTKRKRKSVKRPRSSAIRKSPAKAGANQKKP